MDKAIVKTKRFIIGFNRSQLIANLLRAKGHYVVTCDLQEPDEPTEYHYKGDIFDIFYNKWDYGIFHPPCTYLTSANTYIGRGCSLYTAQEAIELQREAIELFLRVTKCPYDYGIENPIGIMSHHFRLPDQIIQPYEFGDNASKSTCLWLKGLPLLQKRRRDFYPPRNVNGRPRWGNQTDSGQNREPPSDERMNIRAKTYPGIAKAMAEQWPGIMPPTLF